LLAEKGAISALPLSPKGLPSFLFFFVVPVGHEREEEEEEEDSKTAISLLHFSLSFLPWVVGIEHQKMLKQNASQKTSKNIKGNTIVNFPPFFHFFKNCA
jgi:hypothetical protein